MKNNKNFKFNLFIQENQKMSTKFAWLTTVLIAIISLLIAISVIRFVGQIMQDISQNNRNQDLYISAKIFDEIQEDFKNNNLKLLDEEMTSILKTETVAFVIVKDKRNGKVLYSIDGKTRFHNTKRNYQTFVPQYVTPTYTVSVGFYEKQQLRDYLSSFLGKLNLLTISSIFFGLLMSYFMFRIVNKPLETFTEAAKKYKQGNFTIHLEKTSYEEINTLIDTYNSMSDSLNELYTSLEMKVKARTIELENAYKELQNAQTMMVHSEKMKSLGELVAGITHEINNPINFIYGNLIHLQNYTEDMIALITELVELCEKSEENKPKATELVEKYDYEFIKEDLPALIKSCQDGTERTKNIVMDLKNFSRMGENTTSSVDLPKEIDTTLNILNNRIKNRITVNKDYPENLPKIDALGGQLNQVFMNILDNATYAIKDTGNINIRMKSDEKYVTIEIEDDGCGMKKDVAEKIFDPFFTTKPVGEGTGLGMSISYKVIKHHNGTITVDSEEGKGTKFTIVLPIVNKDIIAGA